MKKLFMCASLVIVFTCQQKETHKTDDTRYYPAQILLPDYVHSDTMIVVNSDSLNWAMKYYDAASDGDISDILSAFCIIK